VSSETINQKPRQKKKGKVAEVYAMHQKSANVKEIAEEMKLGERVVRSYIWRAHNPKKYRSLPKRYHEKKKQKLYSTKSEKEEILMPPNALFFQLSLK
jgi:hypothetical protein